MDTKKIVLISSSLFLLLAAPAAQLPSIDISDNSSTMEWQKAPSDEFDQNTVISQDKMRGDADIAQQVKAAFIEDNQLKAFISSVDVTSKEGVVTLSGTVASEKVKSDFEAKAKSVSGVHKVINKIDVKF